MSISKGLTFLVLLAAVGSLQAREIDFNYIEGNFGILDLDVDESATDGVDSISIETDDDFSYDFAGAWQPWKGAAGWYSGLHLFAAVGFAENDIDVSGSILGTPFSANGSVDILRARGGVGYGYPLNEQWNLYGRVTWDYAELQDISLGGANADDIDDDGVGFEGGVRWLIDDSFELQAYGRYTDVGGLDGDLDSDDDTYIGVNGRWYFAERWALQAGGEFGDSYLYNAGVRFDF